MPLTEGMARSLWKLRKERKAADDELVFTTQTGRMVDRRNAMDRVLKLAAVEAGLGEWIAQPGRRRRRRPDTWVGFHTLRHTCATMLFRAGLNAKQV